MSSSRLLIKEDCYYTAGPPDAAVFNGPVYKVANVTDAHVVFHEATLEVSPIGTPTVIGHEGFHEMVDCEVKPMWVRVEKEG